MEEGIFPPSPGAGVPNRKNPWETPSSNQNQDFAGNYPTVSPESVKPQKIDPVVYRTQGSATGSGDGGAKKIKTFPIKKLLLTILGIFISLTIFVIIIFMFTSRSSEPIIEDATLTYWGVFEEESVMRPVLDEFEKENPGIKVQYEKQDLVDYRARLVARTENNRGPDVFRYHNTWYSTISDLLLPLPSDVINKSDFESKYYNVASQDLINNGTVYGIPLYADTLSLYINTDLFATDSASTATIPKTWQEFINTSAVVTKRNDRGAIEVAGAGIGTYENVNYAPDILSLLMAQNGVDLDNPSDYKEEIADAIKFYTNFSRVENNVWDSIQEDSRTAFSQGKLAMFFGYSWDYSEIKARNPNIKMTVVPVPQLIRDDPVNIASYWAEGVSSRSTHKNEAFLLMEFLARGETQERLFEEAKKTRDFGEPYSIVGFADKLNDTPAFVFVDQSKSAISSPFVDVGGGENINTDLNESLKEAVNEVLSRGSEESAVDRLLGGYGKTIGQYLGTE